VKYTTLDDAGAAAQWTYSGGAGIFPPGQGATADSVTTDLQALQHHPNQGQSFSVKANGAQPRSIIEYDFTHYEVPDGPHHPPDARESFFASDLTASGERAPDPYGDLLPWESKIGETGQLVKKCEPHAESRNYDVHEGNLKRDLSILLPSNSAPKGTAAWSPPPPPQSTSVPISAVSNSTSSNVLLVANEESSSLATIDLASRDIKLIPVGSQPHSVVLDADGRRAFVGNFGSDNVSIVDVAKQQVVETIGVGSQPTALAFDAGSSRLYVTNFGDGSLSVVQIQAGGSQLVATIGGVSEPLDIALSPDGRLGYVTSQSGGIVVLDLTTLTITGQIPLAGFDLRNLAVSLDGQRLYVAARTDQQGTGKIVVIDTGNLQVVEQIPVDPYPFGLKISPTGSCLVVTHTIPNRVSFISLLNDQVIASLNDPSAIEPQQTAIVGNLAYVTNHGSDNISAFDISPTCP
jgi:YVTN family beta-propeller protein